MGSGPGDARVRRRTWRDRRRCGTRQRCGARQRCGDGQRCDACRPRHRRHRGDPPRHRVRHDRYADRSDAASRHRVLRGLAGALPVVRRDAERGRLHDHRRPGRGVRARDRLLGGRRRDRIHRDLAADDRRELERGRSDRWRAGDRIDVPRRHPVRARGVADRRPARRDMREPAGHLPAVPDARTGRRHDHVCQRRARLHDGLRDDHDAADRRHQGRPGVGRADARGELRRRRVRPHHRGGVDLVARRARRCRQHDGRDARRRAADLGDVHVGCEPVHGRRAGNRAWPEVRPADVGSIGCARQQRIRGHAVLVFDDGSEPGGREPDRGVRRSVPRVVDTPRLRERIREGRRRGAGAMDGRRAAREPGWLDARTGRGGGERARGRRDGGDESADRPRHRGDRVVDGAGARHADQLRRDRRRPHRQDGHDHDEGDVADDPRPAS